MPSAASASAAFSDSCSVMPAPTRVTRSFGLERRTFEPPIGKSSSGAYTIGVFSLVVRMYEIPGRSAIAAVRRAVAFPSHGYRTVEPWTARIMARSSSPICDGPSSPIETPACEPESRRFARLIAAIRTKSYARVKKAANVAANATLPSTCMPDGHADHVLLGDVTLDEPVGGLRLEVLGVGGVRDLARRSRRRRVAAASAASVSPNALRVAIASA